MSEREVMSSVPEDKPKTMTKFKRRISRILGKDEVKRATQASPSGTAGTAASKSRPEPTEPQDTPAVKSPEAIPKSKKTTSAKPVTAPIRPKAVLTTAEHAKVQEEKVRALFAKYNVTLEVGEWTPPFKADIPRVEKKIRMRVHRTCHRCRTQFGVDKVCNNCNHGCCKKCPRYPLKKTEQPKAKEGTTTVKGETQYVKKSVTQRTRMICHKCQSPFKSKSKECGNCQHERCAQCQREAPKGDITIGGGTGYPLPRVFIKWTCHECENVHRDPEDPCLKCGHSKCDQCSKERVQRGAQQSAENSKVKDVEERMKNLGVSSQATAA